MSGPTITPRQLPKVHPMLHLHPDDPMQFHGAFDVNHLRRSFSVLLTRDNLTAGTNQSPDWRWHISIAGMDMDVPEWATVAACHPEAVTQDRRRSPRGGSDERTRVAGC